MRHKRPTCQTSDGDGARRSPSNLEPTRCLQNTYQAEYVRGVSACSLPCSNPCAHVLLTPALAHQRGSVRAATRLVARLVGRRTDSDFGCDFNNMANHKCGLDWQTHFGQLRKDIAPLSRSRVDRDVFQNALFYGLRCGRDISREGARAASNGKAVYWTHNNKGSDTTTSSAQSALLSRPPRLNPCLCFCNRNLSRRACITTST